MHTKFKKILLLGIALAMGLPAQAMKPGDGVIEMHKALILKFLIEVFGSLVTNNSGDSDPVMKGEAEDVKNDSSDEQGIELQAILSPEEQTRLNSDLIQDAWNGQVKAMNVLIKRGANVNAVDYYGRTPLHWGAIQGGIEVVNALIAAGANVHAVDNDERTPLHWGAGINGQVEFINVLIAAGAELNGVKIEQWNNFIAAVRQNANNRLQLVMWLLGYEVEGIDWADIFTADEITAFLTAPNAEARAPIAECVERVMQNTVNIELRRILAGGLEHFLRVIRENQVSDFQTQAMISLTNDQQALIEGLIEQLYRGYVGPTTKSARKVVESNEGEDNAYSD